MKGNNTSGNNAPHGNAAQQCSVCARVCSVALLSSQSVARGGSRHHFSWVILPESRWLLSAVSFSSRRRSWRSRVYSSRVLDLHCRQEAHRKWMRHQSLPIYLQVWVSMTYAGALWIGRKGLIPSPEPFSP